MPIPAGFVANSSGYYTRGDGAAPFTFDGTSMAFQGSGPISCFSSGNVANAVAAATIPATPGKLSYITGFEVSGAGATAGSVVLCTVAGLLGGTLTYNVTVPAGALIGITPLQVAFTRPVPASAINTAITVSVPALGLGSTNAAVVLRGFSL